MILARAGSEAVTPEDWERIKASLHGRACPAAALLLPCSAGQTLPAVGAQSWLQHTTKPPGQTTHHPPALPSPLLLQRHGLSDSALGSVEHGDRVPDWLVKWTSLVSCVEQQPGG